MGLKSFLAILFFDFHFPFSSFQLLQNGNREGVSIFLLILKDIPALFVNFEFCPVVFFMATGLSLTSFFEPLFSSPDFRRSSLSQSGMGA